MSKKDDKKTAAAYEKVANASSNKDEMPPAPPMPEYELKSYDPVEFTLPKINITEEMIQASINDMADKVGANYETTSRKVVGPKDHVEINIAVYKDGEEIEGLTSEQRLYSLGEGLMPIDFDRGVVGMKVGEEKEFSFEAPDLDDIENMSMRSFDAKVKVLRVMRKADPEVTDEWVKQYMPMYKSAQDYKASVRVGLEKQAENMLEQEKMQRAAAALAQRFEGKIDDYFYEQTRADLMANYEQQAKSQGMDLEDMLGQQGVDQQQFSMSVMFQVREMLTQGFSLDAWARHYNIEVGEDDMKEFLKLMNPQANDEKLDEMLEKVKNQELEKGEEALKIATRRYFANKDLLEKAIVHKEGEEA